MIKKSFFRASAIVGLCCMALFFAICLCACNDADTEPNVLVVGTTMTVDSLNRLDASGGAPGYNFDKIASTLSQLTPVAEINGNFVSVACAFETAQDGTSLTLTVKDGYTWHDGAPLTVDDVEFSLASLSQGVDYESVRKNGNTLDYTLCTTDVKFLEKLCAQSILPKHIFEGKTKETLTDAESVIGAGPFRFAGRDVSAGTITFEKYAEYPLASAVSIDKVVFKQYGTVEVLAGALKSGEIDMIFNYGSGISDDVAKSLAQDDGVTLASYATKALPKVLFFNNAVMTDANVKRAIALCIDYDKIRATFGSSGSTPSRQGLVAEGIFGYKETAVWARNLAEARRLFSDAGYTEQNKLRFELLVRADSDDTRYASLIKTQIEESGVVEVALVSKGSDWQTYYQEGRHMASFAKVTAKGYDFEAGYASRYTLATETSMLDVKNPVAHGQMLVEDESGNLTPYGEILKQMIGAKTAAQLADAVGNYQDYVAQNVVCVPLFYDGVTQACSSKVTGFAIDSASGILNVKSFETLKKTARRAL